MSLKLLIENYRQKMQAPASYEKRGLVRPLFADDHCRQTVDNKVK